jgi:hypothetical protein
MVLLAVALSLAMPAGISATPAGPDLQAPPAVQQPAETAALTDYNAAIEEYLKIHRGLKGEVPVLTVTTSAREISMAADTLAAAIQRARPRARTGDLLNPAVAQIVKVRLRTALAGVDPATFVITINDEPTLKGPPRIHMRYPAASSMATIPPHLLDVLPPLPNELEYRFLGRALVLRDREAALIIDYISDALPRAR